MRFLMEIGSDAVLFGRDVNVTGIIAAFDGATLVHEVSPYNHTKYEPKEEQKISLKLILDEDISFPENKSDSLDTIVKLEKELSDISLERYTWKMKAERLEKELAELRSKEQSETKAV